MIAELESIRRNADTPSGPISYLDVGEGPTALFVHGVGTNSYLWRKVLAGVSDLRRCIAIDLPLHGRSPACREQDFSLGGQAQILEDLCQILEIGQVDLVGNDTGGAVAQVFAVRHPERLRTFTLTNCDTHDNLPPEQFVPTVELAKAGELAPLSVQIAAEPDLARRTALGAGYEDPQDLDDDLIRTFMGPVLGTLEAGRQFERCLIALDEADLVAIEPQLKELTVPTLVVWGTGDPFFDLSWAYWLRDTIPGVTEVVEVPGAKLFFPDERPHDLIPHLRRHWTAHPDPVG